MRSAPFLVGLGSLGSHVLALRPGPQSPADWRDPSPHEVRSITVDSSVRQEVLDWGGSGRTIVLLGCYLTAHLYDDFRSPSLPITSACTASHVEGSVHPTSRLPVIPFSDRQTMFWKCSTS